MTEPGQEETTAPKVKQAFKVCFCFRRMFKLRAAEPTAEIRQVFERYSKNGSMSIDDLHEFLLEFQNEPNATKENAQAIFDSFKHLSIFQRKDFHLEAFFRYLFSDLNSPLPPSREVHHDMNAPLAHYFIYTGHNSYLTGNQLSSDCSVDPIIKALRRGVRGIELDLWPNSARDDVDVYHGGTLTTPVELIKCLRAIKENAFHASDYPVIITFEDHLTRALQAKVAKMVTTIFEDYLYYTKSDHLETFPSPESLKKRIIISTKPPKEYLDDEKTKEKEIALERAKESAKLKSDSAKIIKEIKKNEKIDVPDERAKEYHEDEDLRDAVPEYRHLITVHAGKLKGGLTNWLMVDPHKVRRLSLSEQELESAVRTHSTAIVRFTQRNLLRIYPKGSRLDSSNYNPLIGWMHGAQMVAFNMQGYGKFLWMMHGMFRANGGSGYVKKPEFLLNISPKNEVFDPNRTLPIRKTLKVTVHMGDGWHSDFDNRHFDLFSPPDFYTKVGIVGAKADSVMRKTRVIGDQWVPIWNETFEFPLSVPELALLRIKVLEYDPSGRNDFAGQTCLPVSELKSGIRAVPLHNHRGEQYKSVKLLMCFQFV